MPVFENRKREIAKRTHFRQRLRAQRSLLPLSRPPLSAPSSRRRFLLVHNPIAGLANRPLLGEVLRALEAKGAEVVITSQKPPMRSQIRKASMP